MNEPADPDVLLVRIGGTPAGHEAAADGKQAAIVRAATELFLRQGYQATRTEQIASSASVSKQTVYNRFGDKESLFREIVLGVTATAEAFAADLPTMLDGVTSPPDLDAALRVLAVRYLTAVMNPRGLALRRLVISEAIRLPELAVAYYERAPARVLAALAAQIEELAGRGLLAVTDPATAAADFAFLVLGRPLDEGMFHVREHAPQVDELAAIADHAVDVFLAAYGCRD